MLYKYHRTPADGTCLFHAVAMGLYDKFQGDVPPSDSDIRLIGKALRNEVLDYMLRHKRRYQRMLNELPYNTYNENNRFENINDHIKHMRNPRVYAANMELHAIEKYVKEQYGFEVQAFVALRYKKIFDSSKNFIETTRPHSNNTKKRITIVLINEHYSYVQPMVTNVSVNP